MPFNHRLERIDRRRIFHRHHVHIHSEIWWDLNAHDEGGLFSGIALPERYKVKTEIVGVDVTEPECAGWNIEIFSAAGRSSKPATDGSYSTWGFDWRNKGSVQDRTTLEREPEVSISHPAKAVILQES